MKTRLLWMLILLVGGTALYFGIVRPEVSTTPKRIQDFLDKDPATQPPIQLPPLVVSEPRLPPPPLEPVEPAARPEDVRPHEDAALKETVEGARKGEAKGKH